mmetsp:Transcript_31243/g.75196  ORF Transcript_31243/g.75196 Transcript_31243/m.75196 type:complete len:229 (+) Transcript_31243:3252-3938(+)
MTVLTKFQRSVERWKPLHRQSKQTMTIPRGNIQRRHLHLHHNQIGGRVNMQNLHHQLGGRLCLRHRRHEGRLYPHHHHNQESHLPKNLFHHLLARLLRSLRLQTNLLDSTQDHRLLKHHLRHHRPQQSRHLQFDTILHHRSFLAYSNKGGQIKGNLLRGRRRYLLQRNQHLICKVRRRSPMLICHQGGCACGQKARNDGTSLTLKQTRACGSGHHHEKLELHCLLAIT